MFIPNHDANAAIKSQIGNKVIFPANCAGV